MSQSDPITGEAKSDGLVEVFHLVQGQGVNLVTKGGRKVREVANELDIDVNTLYHWKRQLLKEGEEAFPGKGNLTAQEEEIRLARGR